MKRFLLSGLLLLAMGRTAFCYVNNAVVQVPPMDPALIQIDDTNFINNSRFSVDLTSSQFLTANTVLFETSDTLNYINRGVLTSVPGFDFQNFPSSVGQARWAANFVNTNNGFGGGEIYVTNIFGGGNVFANAGLFGFIFLPINFELVGLATFRAHATNIVDSGLIQMDNTGLIDLTGGDVDLRRARLVMTGANTFSNSTFGVSYLDWGSGSFGTNSLFWQPIFDLTPTTALSPFYLSSVTGFFEQMFLTNATTYFENLNPAPGADGVIVWRGIYLQDFSPTNVTKSVFFGNSGVGSGAFHIEWAGAARDPFTGQVATNYFYLSDVPVIRRDTNVFFGPPFIPNDISFAESTNRIILGTPATPAYTNPAPVGLVSNDFSYISLRPNAVLVDTNTVIGGNPTNLPGRIQITATHSLNLADAHIVGPNYVSLRATNGFLGNKGAVITAPYSDLDIGVTSGSLTLSNLLVSELPSWTGVPGAPSAVFSFGFIFAPVEMGGIQAWSGSYLFVDVNGITNDVRMLLVNSALQPSTPALQQDVFLHASNNLVISDELNIFRHFRSDATVLTITTNDNSAFSLAGELNLLSSDIFWSDSLPNLQYLTNFGVITTRNLANFAGNMSPNSDPALATPYQAFVNHGFIVNQGAFIRANYFENSGVIQENIFGNIDINVTTSAIATNGSFIAPQGSVTIAANSLFASNGVITAGQDLTLTFPCSLSDGYVLENQFGHITNSVLPNVVTNGNIWTVGGGVRIMVKPPTADLLGTTITNVSANGLDSINVWPGDDRGASPAGYATNLALGRMILNADATSQFTFISLGGNNALYVDSLELQGNTTNTDGNGNPLSIAIQSGMNIYYAQALQNGESVAEKLDGKYGAITLTNGGRFFWVSNYAGVYSSTNLAYPDGNTYIFNEALVISPNIDSDGDDKVNKDTATPIPTNLVFDIDNIGPQPCGSATGDPSGPPGGPSISGTQITGKLNFPAELSNSQTSNPGPISFALAQGSYNGLFYDTNGVNPASAGFFTAKVTSKGGLTAKLQLGTKTYSFSKPPFDVSGHFSGAVTGKGLPSLNVDLQLVNNDRIVGQVSGDGWTAQLLADRAAFSSKNKAPWAGNHTLLLGTKETNSTAAAGDSFGTVTISSSGSVQWSGTLPDGAKVTQKSALSKDGTWPLYSSPYGGSGSFIGWMQCTNESDIIGSGVWVLPPSKSGLYPQGLTNELHATGSGVSGSISAFSHSTATFSSSSLSLTNHVVIFGNTAQNGTLQLSINPKTGLFNGSVVNPNNNQKLLFQGALLEKSGIGGGFFLNAGQNQGGKVQLAPAN